MGIAVTAELVLWICRPEEKPPGAMKISLFATLRARFKALTALKGSENDRNPLIPVPTRTQSTSCWPGHGMKRVQEILSHEIGDHAGP